MGLRRHAALSTPKAFCRPRRRSRRPPTLTHPPAKKKIPQKNPKIISPALDLGSVVQVKHVDEVKSDRAAFAREHVGCSKPLLVLDALGRRCPVTNGAWTPAALLSREGSSLVTLTVTPDGRADAVVSTPPDGEERFVLPYEERVPLSAFLRPDGTLVHGGGGGGNGNGAVGPPQRCVRYLSSQNGCLAAELPGLLRDMVDPDEQDEEDQGDQEADAEAHLRRRGARGPAWARSVLRRQGDDEGPPVVNIWIGDALSETSLHRDPYDNLAVVVRGTKTFTLYPPHEAFRLGLEPFAAARWEKEEEGGDGRLVARPLPAPPAQPVLWTALDPSLQSKARKGCPQSKAELERQRGRYPLAFGGAAGEGGNLRRRRLPPPIEVEVRAGQGLYLPAFWWHHVRQRGPDEEAGGGCCVSVNWWYEARHDSRYALAQAVERLAVRAGLLRPLRLLGDGAEEEEEDEEDDD